MAKGHENLRPLGSDKNTKEVQREIQSKGGKASAEKRRQRRTFREEFLTLLECGDIQEKISMAMLQQAMEGNTKAFEVVRDTVGEKPTEKIAVSTLNEDSISKLQDAIKKRRKK